MPSRRAAPRSPSTQFAFCSVHGSHLYANWTYAPDGSRVATAVNAGGVNSYSFSGVGASITVTDPLGTGHNYTQQLVFGVYRHTGSDLTCAGCSDDKTRVLDANSNVISRTNFNKNLTCYAYDTTRNLETTRVEGFAPGSVCPASLSTYTPAGGTRERKITTTWHATYRLPTLITEANRTTGFTHDASGNVLTKTVTDTSVVPNVLRVNRR